MRKIPLSGFVSAISVLCIDRFSPNFVASASWDKDEQIRFWGQNVKGHGHRTKAYRVPRCNHLVLPVVLPNFVTSAFLALSNPFCDSIVCHRFSRLYLILLLRSFCYVLYPISCFTALYL